MNKLRLEIAFWMIGLAFTAAYGIARVDAAVSGSRDVASFHSLAEPDARLWSASRRQSWLLTPQPAADELVGVLVIRSLQIEAPLYADTSELYLNRGVGLIPQMARPDQLGNIGIAGHRDGFFRALEAIEQGATIELITRSASYRYRVVTVDVVGRDNTELLRRSDSPLLTLVTCHPFYFVGSAPDRFVVRSVLISSQGRRT
jgi:sortase A